MLRPLFFTGFLIDDFLADSQSFGARQLLLSSASSKTAFGTAFCLSLRRGQPGTPRVMGLTSSANLAFAQSLGVYDEVRLYDSIAALDPAVPTVYVDFAGGAALRHSVHAHFGDALRFSSSIGARIGKRWVPAVACPAPGRPSSSRRRRSGSAAPRRPKAGARTAWHSAWASAGRPSWPPRSNRPSPGCASSTVAARPRCTRPTRPCWPAKPMRAKA